MPADQRASDSTNLKAAGLRTYTGADCVWSAVGIERVSTGDGNEVYSLISVFNILPVAVFS